MKHINGDLIMLPDELTKGVLVLLCEHILSNPYQRIMLSPLIVTTNHRMRNTFMKSKIKSFKLRCEYLIDCFAAIKKTQ